MTPTDYEYPDVAGYPDGTGTLDEGTATPPAAAALAASDEIESGFENFLGE